MFKFHKLSNDRYRLLDSNNVILSSSEKEKLEKKHQKKEKVKEKVEEVKTSSDTVEEAE